PLWRYDGYFVLADLLDRVNLWDRSRAELSMGIEQLYFRPGASQHQDSPYDRDRWLMVYALASIFYQWIVTVLVVVVVYSTLRVVRLEVLGAALVTLILASAFVRPPLRRLVALLGDRHRLRRLRAGRVGMTLVIVLCLLAGFIAWPLPCHVQAPVLVRPLEMHPVVIVAGGQLQSCVAEGVVVSQGQRLAQLSSPMDELAIAAKQGELARQRTHLEGLEAKRGNEPIIGAQIGSTKQAIQGLESELQRLLASAANLEIRAPVAGRVIAPASRPSRLHSKTWSDQPIEPVTGTDVSVERAFDEMEFWSGTPLERANLGCFLLPGQHLCQIAATDAALEGLVYLTQSQVEWIQVGQSANCRLPALPADTFRGEIVEVAASAQRDIPIQLAQSGSIPTRPVGPSRFESVEPLYVARIRFDSVARTPIPFSSGLVSIQARPLPMATRLWRLLSETFHRR
ncbi:MAG: hypothetical protein IT423_21360, partial [Pirellulaceae bacterium]|nr:hypothetical protein [Pirellulaceae bacterium]